MFAADLSRRDIGVRIPLAAGIDRNVYEHRMVSPASRAGTTSVDEMPLDIRTTAGLYHLFNNFVVSKDPIGRASTEGVCIISHEVFDRYFQWSSQANAPGILSDTIHNPNE